MYNEDTLLDPIMLEDDGEVGEVEPDPITDEEEEDETEEEEEGAV